MEVDKHNDKEIKNLPGQAYIFKAEDTGDQQALKKCPLQSILKLKKDTPVMLIVSLNEQFANGMKGHIADINENEVLYLMSGLGDMCQFVNITIINILLN